MSPSIEEMQQMALDYGFCLLTSDECEPKPEQIAAFRDRIIASLCGDVEPVAMVVVHDSQPAEFFCTPAFTDLPAGEHDLHSASTVAALKARVAELEKDAARGRLLLKWLCDGRIPGAGHGKPIKLVETCPQFGDETEVKNIGALLDAALTKGRP